MTGPSLEADLTRVVLPLVAVESDGAWRPIGTAFVISVFGPTTALLMTAAHNIEYAWTLDAARRPRSARLAPDLEPHGPKNITIQRTRTYAGVDGPNEFVLADLVKSWHVNEFDVAFVVAVIPAGCPASFVAKFAVDFSPVAPGCHLTALGYGRMSADFSHPPNYEAEDFRVQFYKKLEVRSGVVTNALPQGRGMYKWPGFLMDCAFDSGMSGGPIIDLSREVPTVRGVISGDMTENVNDSRVGSGGHAYGSVLWPALATDIELEIEQEGHPPVLVKNAFDLIDVGAVDDQSEAASHFTLRRTEEGTVISWF